MLPSNIFRRIFPSVAHLWCSEETANDVAISAIPPTPPPPIVPSRVLPHNDRLATRLFGGRIGDVVAVDDPAAANLLANGASSSSAANGKSSNSVCITDDERQATASLLLISSPSQPLGIVGLMEDPSPQRVEIAPILLLFLSRLDEDDGTILGMEFRNTAISSWRGLC